VCQRVAIQSCFTATNCTIIVVKNSCVCVYEVNLIIFNSFFLYSVSTGLALTQKRTILQERILIDNSKCASELCYHMETITLKTSEMTTSAHEQGGQERACSNN
jgi:hypothetical protein